MAWLWQQALGTVFLESGINRAHRFSVLHWYREKSRLQPTAVKKIYLIFAGENFSIEIITYIQKEASSKLKTENKMGKTRQRCLLRSEGPVC